jgi:glycosyltransferase involved in cell wall biosynthesis
MRRVLILAYDFPPRGATGVIRVTKFVRYLPEFGWQPVVVAAAVRGGMLDEALLAQLPPELETIRVENRFAPGNAVAGRHAARPSLRARIRQQMRRLFIPDPQLLWVPGVLRATAQRLARGDVDALMTTAPPYSVHVAGLWLKRRFPHLPWLMDLRDIWSENPVIPNLLSYKLHRAWEWACLSHADLVTTATDGQRRLIERSFAVPPGRISTITNGFDPADLPALAPPPHSATLRLTHVGSLVGNRAAATKGLFDALTLLAAQGITADDLQVRLVGVFDPEIYHWSAVLLERGLVQLVPFVPYAEAVAEMTAAQVLLLITADDREGRLSHPNKLFEYFALGRPILALTPEGDVARLIREAEAGVAVPPLASEQIVVALHRLLAEHRAGQLGIAANPSRFARFERRELTRQLAERLDTLCVPAALAAHELDTTLHVHD